MQWDHKHWLIKSSRARTVCSGPSTTRRLAPRMHFQHVIWIKIKIHYSFTSFLKIVFCSIMFQWHTSSPPGYVFCCVSNIFGENCCRMLQWLVAQQHITGTFGPWDPLWLEIFTLQGGLPNQYWLSKLAFHNCNCYGSARSTIRWHHVLVEAPALFLYDWWNLLVQLSKSHSSFSLQNLHDRKY
jgi:hypothetical protein